ncbi:MAG: amidohydrolase [Flavobacteriales bacterium]|nr:amidohydrolase [Flavobacteriales bacterium]
MKILYVLSFTLLVSSCMKTEEVDLIIHNGNIVSVTEDSLIFDAMAIKSGRIIAIGKEQQILNKYSAAESIDLQLDWVYPGFIDAHCHFLGYGLSLQQLELKGTKSFEEVVERCINFNKNNISTWIEGRGWDQTIWENSSNPNKKALDDKFPNTPVLLRRVDGHMAIANQSALNIAGITTETEISGGFIEILNGEITGIISDKAVDHIRQFIPKPNEQQKKKALLDAQRNCFAVGLTTVDDAGLNKSDVQLIENLEKSEELKMRIYIMLSDTKENFDYYLDTVGGPYKTDRINVAAFKFYGDGALGSRGACLLSPYSDVDSAHYGMLLNNPNYYREKAQLIYDRGFQMCTHSIGDSTSRLILNIYGDILGGENDKRWRIEHAQVVDSADFKLFKEFNIIPSVQPTHATSDMRWARLRLGKTRIRFGYAYQKLLYQNKLIALGTDFPIENISPIETFYAAVARKNKNGMPKNGFQIENALSRWETLKGMTIWAALSNFEEQDKGSLEVNKLADFTILDRNILTVPEDEILETQVKATYVNGELVYKH